jgi:DNA-directed RNA polymerase subunit M/transcription elongation factor TFIIS
VVKRAIDEGDNATLLKLVPGQRLAIQLGDYNRVLVAAEVVSSGPAPLALGPSSSSSSSSSSSTGLALTNVGRVGAPGSSSREYKEKQKARLRMVHDSTGTHIYGEHSMNWECARCNRFPAARCRTCEAQRCARCSHDGAVATPVSQPSHRVSWKQNDLNPAPFFVQNPVKLSNAQQVEWMRDELPANATLEEFAQTYMQLLADRVTDDGYKRSHCLELFRKFNPEFRAKKESDLIPSDLESFQKVFETSAPTRCRWCSRAMPPGGSYEFYCSDRCHASENPPSKCGKCGWDEILIAPQRRTASDLGRWPPPKTAFAKCTRCAHCWETNIVTMTYDPKSMPAAPAEPAYKMRKRS